MSKVRPKKPRGESPGVQQLTGTPPQVHCDGKVWRLGFNTQDAKGRLEELVRSHVVRDALRTMRAVGGEDGRLTYEMTDAKVKKGHYATFAEGWADVLHSPVGAVLFLQSLLQHCHPDATEADAARLLAAEEDQTFAALTVIAPDFYEALAIQRGLDPAAARAFASAVEIRFAGRGPAEPAAPTAGPAPGSATS